MLGLKLNVEGREGNGWDGAGETELYETKIFSRVAVDMAVAILEGGKPGKDIPFRMETRFTELTPESVKAGGMTYEDFFAPKDWNPVFSYKP